MLLWTSLDPQLILKILLERFLHKKSLTKRYRLFSHHFFPTDLWCLAGIYMHKQREFPFKRSAGSASNGISICVFERTQNYNPETLSDDNDQSKMHLKGT